MSPSLQVWADFFDELDQEAQAREALTQCLRTASTAQYEFLTASWLDSLHEIRQQKASLPAELETLMPSMLDKQFSLQSCLTQALCILDEVKDTPDASSLNTQFGDFSTLLGLLEEANSHLHTMMMD